MVTALIFAGGTGQRMNTKSKPKQFLELHGKPVIIYTIEHFEYHHQVDSIVAVCLKDWIGELQWLLKRYGITKVKAIVAGGDTGHDSIYLGLDAMREFMSEEDIVLIHDGVRPLIDEDLISKNIEMVKECGNAITSEAVRESVVQCENGQTISHVPPRSEMYVAKAPQSFYYGRIYELYKKAQADNKKTIERLINVRYPIYEKADITVPSYNESPFKTASRVIHELKKQGLIVEYTQTPHLKQHKG